MKKSGGDNEKHKGPYALSAYSMSPTSITLQWKMNNEMQQNLIQYRIHYAHGVVRSYVEIEPYLHELYELTGLDPLTEYKVSVEAVFNGQQSIRSNPIKVRTYTAGI